MGESGPTSACAIDSTGSLEPKRAGASPEPEPGTIFVGISAGLIFPKSILIRTDNLVRSQVNLAGIPAGLTFFSV
jgi:hypothetical protein